MRRQSRVLNIEKLESRELLAGDIWGQRGGDSGHTSFANVAVEPTNISESWFQEINYTQSGTGSWRERAVAIDESHVYRTALEGYAPSGTYHVIAYDLATGAEVWHNTLIGNAFEGVGEPSVAGGIVYVNRAGHSGISGGTSADLPRLYGFDASSGAVVLQEPYAAQWGSNERPVIDDNQLFVEDGYFGGISAYTASTLTEQWFVGRGAAYSQPFAALNSEYAFAFGNEVYRRSDGLTLPNIVHPAEASSVSAPIVANDGDPLFSFSGRVDDVSVRGVASFDGFSHEHQWSFETESSVNQKAVGNGLVAVTAGDTLYLLDESDGSLVDTWSNGFSLGEVILTQTHAFVISLNYTTATVNAVNLNSGSVDWSHSQNSPGGSALVEMAISQGHLVLSDRTGVRAFEIEGAGNRNPTAVDDVFQTTEDVVALLDVLANDSDPDQDRLEVSSVTSPANGVADVLPDGSIRYTPNPNFFGSDAFYYTIRDGNGGEDSARVQIEVGPVNDSPTAIDDVFQGTEDVVAILDVLSNDSDPDQDHLEISAITSPANGVADVLSDGSIRYTPNQDFFGADEFSYTVRDGNGGEDSALVRISMAAANDPPTVEDSEFSMEENAPLGASVGNVIAADVDGDALTFALQGADSLAFDIDSNTGEIFVAEPLLMDFETTPQFDFEVAVYDGQGGLTIGQVQVTLTNQVEVEVDILPSDPLNQISLKSKTIEVAILANADLDPLTMLDVGSLRLRSPNSADGASVSRHKKHGFRTEYRDVNGDGMLDLVVRFDLGETGLQLGDEELELTGALLPEFGGESFQVTQQVQVSRGSGKGSPRNR